MVSIASGGVSDTSRARQRAFRTQDRAVAGSACRWTIAIRYDDHDGSGTLVRPVGELGPYTRRGVIMPRKRSNAVVAAWPGG